MRTRIDNRAGFGGKQTTREKAAVELRRAAELLVECLEMDPLEVKTFYSDFGIVIRKHVAADALVNNASIGGAAARSALSILHDCDDAIADKGEPWAAKVLSAIDLFRRRHERHLVKVSREWSAAGVTSSPKSNVIQFPALV
jgi:hypothetical protein